MRKGGTDIGLVVVILAIVALVALYLGIGKGTTITQPVITTNPTIAVAGVDAQSSGTSITNTIWSSFNGGSFGTGTSTVVPGQLLELILVNATTYHNQHVTQFTASATSFPLSVTFNKNATITESWYSTTGTVLTNSITAGGAQNQTTGGNGASYTFKDEMTASALTSTQDMTCVIEVSAGNNLSSAPAGVSLSLSGNAVVGTTSKPGWYSISGVNSAVYVFDVPAQSTTALQTYTIGVNSKSDGSLIAGSFIQKSCYTKEWFIDSTTGKATYGVANSANTVQSLAQYKYKIFFA